MNSEDEFLYVDASQVHHWWGNVWANFLFGEITLANVKPSQFLSCLFLPVSVEEIWKNQSEDYGNWQEHQAAAVGLSLKEMCRIPTFHMGSSCILFPQRPLAQTLWVGDGGVGGEGGKGRVIMEEGWCSYGDPRTGSIHIFPSSNVLMIVGIQSQC